MQRHLTIVSLAACLALFLFPSAAATSKRPSIKIKKDWFVVNKERFLVKGIGYSDNRPFEQPNTRKIDLERIRDDFQLIRDAGFNTIRTWKPLSLEELQVAHEYGLFVIQGIWVEYRQNYADPGRVEAIVSQLQPVVHESSQAPNVLMFLVGNEPQPAQVFSVGRKKTDRFFKQLRMAIRKNADHARVSVSNWVQCDFLNDDMWDVAALNIYNYNPESVSHALGYRGYVDWLKRTRAPERPLILTEFGLSVSQSGLGRMEYGGNSPEEQMQGVLQEYQDALNANAQGACVFEWIDEWWKNFNHPSDAQVHEPSDAEEWFGISYYDKDGAIHTRPAYDALKEFNQAILRLPADRSVVRKKTPVEVYVEEDIAWATIQVNDNEPLPLKRKSPHWFTGKLDLRKVPDGELAVTMSAGRENSDKVYKRTHYLYVDNARKRETPLSVRILLDQETYYTQNRMTSVRIRFEVVDALGQPVPDQDITVSIYEPVINQKLKIKKTTNDSGLATHVYHVNEEGILTVAAGVESFPGVETSTISKIHPAFFLKNGECKHIKIYYSKGK